MATPSWMLMRLALETREYHVAADDDRLAMLDVSSIAGYRAMLERIYGFEAPVEAALACVTELHLGFVRERAKTERLAQDLFTLGLSRDTLDARPRCTHITIRTASQALGWLFVLERQTLIAGQLRRHIVRRLGPEASRAVRYLGAYGDTPGARFRELGEVLSRLARTYTPGAIVRAAIDAFRAQRHWYLTAPASPAEHPRSNQQTADARSDDPRLSSARVADLLS